MEPRKRGDVHAKAREQDVGVVSHGTTQEYGPDQWKASPVEDNWNTLSHLVETEVENIEETAPARLDARRLSSRVNSSKQEIRRTSSDAQSTRTLQNDCNYSKSSLSFILDDDGASTAVETDDVTSGSKRAAAFLSAKSRSTGDLMREAISDEERSPQIDLATDLTKGGRSSRAFARQQGTDGKRRARRPPSRICKHEGCEQYVVDQGLCVRHGGGKRCQAVGCTSRAKHLGRCWKHGGSTECKIPSCINRAKSRGFCWSHGGGTKCKAETCEKIAISNGLCWAHGGGKRCAVKGCMRQAYERTDNLCNHHCQERQRSVAGITMGEQPNASNSNLYDEDKPPAPSADL